MSLSDRLFPGTPRIESPVFDADLDHFGLTDAERETAIALNRRGYAVIDFPDADLDARIARIRAKFAPVFGIDDTDPEAIKQNPKGRVQDAWKTDDDVRAIAVNAAVIDLLSKLYGRRAFPFQSLNFPVGTQQHLHTDAVHFSSIPPRFMCGVWLALEDIAPEAGPLCYVPGSHQWPMIDNMLIGRRGRGADPKHVQQPYHDAWNAMIAARGATVETFAAKKGQALIWCANLLHGGSPQSDPRRTRWSQVTHYYFDDCVYYTPAFSDEALGRLHLRHLVSIADGQPRRNLYLGEEVLPPPSSKRPPTLAQKTLRALRKVTRA